MAEEHATLEPGTIRVFGPRGSIVLGIGLWARKTDSGWIQIHITGGENFHTTVTNSPTSQRYHRTLFRNLRRRLIENDAWTFGDDGSETEDA